MERGSYGRGDRSARGGREGHGGRGGYGVRGGHGGRGGHGRRGGHGGPPPELSGRDIGLWYAARGKKKKEQEQRRDRPVVSLQGREQAISDMLVRFHATTAQTSADDNYAAVQDASGRASPPAKELCTQLPPDTWEIMADEAESKPVEPTSAASAQLSPSTLERLPELSELAEGVLAEGNSEPVQRYKPPHRQAERPLSVSSQRVGCDEGLRARLLEFRQQLPAFSMRDELLQIVQQSQVSVISGETGCGKTTQVPQLVLDTELARRGAEERAVSIICTQPRRISAISVAERVAQERGEHTVGGSVGYQIRLESRLPTATRGSVVFCTPGILLRRMASDKLLSTATHIILDEVHERDIMTDFLLISLRDMLPARPDLKVILMSATLNAPMFAAYFNDCPTIEIPGKIFPVQQLFLEDAFEITRFLQDPESGGRRRSSGSRRGARESIEDEDEKLRQKEECLHQLYQSRQYSDSTLQAVQDFDDSQVDIDLLFALVEHIVLRMPEGAVLCFLPGWDDISKLHERLIKAHTFRDTSRFVIIPLHSMMPTVNQKTVFDRPPPGTRKIILSTNIAETSITIDDIVYVVDSGYVKEKDYDFINDIDSLRALPISRASARQRKGRAGRVQPGTCFHLFTRYQYDRMDEYQKPEMLRTSLEELCLQIKLLRLGSIQSYLAKALQPPPEKSVTNAIEALRMLKALDMHENLTPLGVHLASLPVPPRIGKMILYGAMLQCLDPVLIIAASLSFRDPFVIPLNKQKEADMMRKRLSNHTYSDHLTLLYAFIGWKRAKAAGNEREYCWEHFLSSSTLCMIDKNDQGCQVENPRVSDGRPPKRPAKLYTKQDGKVNLHPKSILADEFLLPTQWLLYHKKVRSSQLFIYDVTPITPLPLLFFGGDITSGKEQDQEIISVDEFMVFRTSSATAKKVQELQAALSMLLEQKVKEPSLPIQEVGSELIATIVQLISDEGADLAAARERLALGKKVYYR